MSKLITKIIGASVEGLSKSFVPQSAVKYNLVRGVSDAKGKFEIISLFDKDNKLIKRVADYTDTGRKSVSIYDAGENHWFKNTRHFLNGQKSGEVNTLIQKTEGNNWLMLKENVSPDISKQGDLHEIATLQAGKKKKGFEYYTSWDGEQPYIHKFNNISKINTRGLNQSDSEYFPCLVSFNTQSRVSQKLNHIAKIQEKKFGLSGIVPSPRRVSYKGKRENILATSDIENHGEASPLTGGVTINKKITDSTNMIETLGHEYQHASDFSDILRSRESIREFEEMPLAEILEIEKHCPGALRFAKHSIKRGAIAESSVRGQELEKLEKAYKRYVQPEQNLKAYQENLLEQRAVSAGAEEVQRFSDCLKSIFDFFSFA